MNIFHFSVRKTYTLMIAALLAGCLWLGGNQRAYAADVASCYVDYGSSYLYLFDAGFESCAKTIRAAAYSAEYGYGYWGSVRVAVDRQGNAYYVDNAGQWQYAGVVQNSLWDRCMAGDVSACNTYSNNADNLLRQWDYLYPNGWSQ
ncbi:MAG: hypothetical protein R2911_21670 [Caldilineaceae bacterium]